MIYIQILLPSQKKNSASVKLLKRRKKHLISANHFNLVINKISLLQSLLKVSGDEHSECPNK